MHCLGTFPKREREHFRYMYAANWIAHQTAALTLHLWRCRRAGHSTGIPQLGSENPAQQPHPADDNDHPEQIPNDAGEIVHAALILSRTRALSPGRHAGERSVCKGETGSQTKTCNFNRLRILRNIHTADKYCPDEMPAAL